MPDVAEQIPNLPPDVHRTARVIADVVGESMWASGKNPKGVATTCIYLADLIHDRDDRLSQQYLDEHSPTSYATIRVHYRKLPEIFIENATEADVARFDDPSMVMDRLELFLRAEQHPNDDIGVYNYERLRTVDGETNG